MPYFIRLEFHKVYKIRRLLKRLHYIKWLFPATLTDNMSGNPSQLITCMFVYELNNINRVV